MTILNKNRIAKLAGLLKEQAVDEWIDEKSADDDLVLGGGAASGSIHDEEEFEDDEEGDITVYDALEDDDLEELDPDTDLGLYGEPLTRHQPDKHFAHHTGMYEGLSSEDYLAGYDESPEDEEPIDPPDWERDEWGKIIDPHFPDDADKEFRQRGQREQEEYHGIDLDNLDDLDSDYEDEEENRHDGGSIKFETLKRIIREAVRRQLNEKKKGLPPWLKPGFKNKKKTDDKSCESDPTSKKKMPSKNKPFFLKKKSKK